VISQWSNFVWKNILKQLNCGKGVKSAERIIKFQRKDWSLEKKSYLHIRTSKICKCIGILHDEIKENKNVEELIDLAVYLIGWDDVSSCGEKPASALELGRIEHRTKCRCPWHSGRSSRARTPEQTRFRESCDIIISRSAIYINTFWNMLIHWKKRYAFIFMMKRSDISIKISLFSNQEIWQTWFFNTITELSLMLPSKY